MFSKICRIGALAVTVCGSISVIAAAESPKPNVLFIVTDDQGFSDFGFTGNPLVKTPNIDRLSSQSAVFENFVVAPACSPSRAAFYTGRDHLHTGVWGVPPRDNLGTDEALLPLFFKASGYRTLYAGKRDMAVPPNSTPWERGWDNGYFVSGYQHKDPALPNRGATIHPKGWTCDVVTDLILDFWQRNPDGPWLVTAAYIIPHLPFVCDERSSAPFLEAGLSADLALCYGSLFQLDAAIGRLLDGLQESGQADNTIVVLVSDNGMSGKASPDREYAADDWAKRNTHQLRGNKALVWENGIRVPCLIRWPGRILAGKRPQLGAAEDLLPTMLDLAGVSPDSISHLPFTGVSLRPVLDDAAAEMRHPDVFRMAISGPGSPRDLAAGQHRKFEDHHLTLRGPRFKYHAFPGGKSALYDVAVDPGESIDIQEQFPKVTAEMATQIRNRWNALIAEGRCFLPVPDSGKKKKESPKRS
jgi:arylsulfatase A-like enzyme